jgi:23S rRNA-/tRNA-specific pseudouridylate synthase
MIPILYENQDIIVVEKPANMPAQKDISRTADMLSVTETYLGIKPFIIHRLDRHVAGPVIIAKTKQAARKMNEQLVKGLITKYYKAVVISGKNDDVMGKYLDSHQENILVHYIGKANKLAKVISEEDYMKLNVSEKLSYKKAVLIFTCIQTKSYDTINISLLKIQLITGRFHQIRAQLSFVGLPILGDPKYGVTECQGEYYKRIGLQSISIGFNDPKTKKDMFIQCEHFDKPFNLFRTNNL